jgi:inosine-uridine nucleoside N-ribohydrolase
MKTMILDDGWQKDESRNFYSATGDWNPVPSRFPDMKEHVAKVHAAGIERYMLWFAVPFVGDQSAAWARFKDKLLNPGTTNVGVLDPRFPEVREYLVSTYVRAVGEWGFDGLKLDFIDEFKLPASGDPAEKDGYAGRDIRSLPVAVDTLMKEIARRLAEIRPDVLIEFRQRYMGPAIRQYGNMIRALDCPADSDKIRRLVCDLRLTSGDTAVHSDMLVWSPEEPPERAARTILNSLFSTIQYSMVLARIPASHRDVMRHWISFAEAHRAALQEGSFRPEHPELNYPLITGESADERITAIYAAGLSARVPDDAKTVYVVNATAEPSLVLDLSAARKAEVYDTFGRKTGSRTLAEGLVRLAVPASGYVRLSPFGGTSPVKVIFDTDMITDYDDMGALATLHALADRGECEILATVSSTRGNASVAAIEICNAFCGRPDLPVGAPKSGSAVRGAPFGHDKYVRLRGKYARWVRHADADSAPDAVEVYRKTLASQPDASVVVCTVGFLTNLRDLLASKPDAISPLSGRDLVKAKVVRWVAMGGFYPWGEEYNFKGDPVASRDVLRDWPTPMVYTDGQYGKDVYTGRRLAETPQEGNPVHDVYAWTMEPRETITRRSWDQHAGHSSWDQTAVLIAVRGVDSYFTPEYGTYEMTDDKGRDEWRYDLKSPSCRILEKTPRTRVAEVIDELMESAGRK